MRTTLTLEPDVARKVKERVAKEGSTLKRVVNDALRVGLSGETAAGKRRKFRVKPHDLSRRPGIDPNRFNRLLDELEADHYAGKMNRDDHP